MRTKPIPYDDSPPTESIGMPTGIARRIGARLLHEAGEALPPTLFFFVGFNFIVFTTNLLLADYAIAISSFMLATVAALVVGKAVLVANAMPYLRRYDPAPLVQPILVQDGVLLGYSVLRTTARALRALLDHRAQSAERFHVLFDYDLLVAPVLRDLPVDLRSFFNLRDRVGSQPPLRPWRAAAALLHLPSVRPAAQSATAHP